jgi:hypothetical protein
MKLIYPSTQFTEAESNMQDLIAEYQQYQEATYVFSSEFLSTFCLLSISASRTRQSTRRRRPRRRKSKPETRLSYLGKTELALFVRLDMPYVCYDAIGITSCNVFTLENWMICLHYEDLALRLRVDA